MKRLAIYTSIDGKLISKVIDTKNFNNNEYVYIPVPQGRVTLKKYTVKFVYEHQFTEIWVEPSIERIINDENIVKQALDIYSEDMFYESCYKL